MGDYSPAPLALLDNSFENEVKLCAFVTNLIHTVHGPFLAIFSLTGLLKTCLYLPKTMFIVKYDSTMEESLN